MEVVTDDRLGAPNRSEPTTGNAPDENQAAQARSLAVDFPALAEFRYLIRRFLASSEELAKEKGITPRQHQLMLAIAGCPPGEEPTIRYLAERLRIKHHSAVGLVDRLESLGLVKREHSSSDRRQVFVRLSKPGAAVLENLSASHRRELRTLAPRLVEALQSVVQCQS